MSLDDYTGIEEEAKQSGLDQILFNINQMYKYGKDSDTVSFEVEDITIKDIEAYLKKIEIEQDSPIKFLTINSVTISNIDDNSEILDGFSTYPISPSYNQKVYFIEGGEFALTLIPIEVEDGKIHIIIQPLESSLPYIKHEFGNMVANRDRKGRKKSVAELRKEIHFVVFPKQRK